MTITRILAALTIGLSGGAAAKDAKPLFASSDVIQITFNGQSAGASDKPRPGSIVVGNETLPITFTSRGITRKSKDICGFPPIRVTFTQPPPETSLFAKQKRLKLVTHCRSSADFQQYELLEQAAYRMYNRLTPVSFLTRLAMINYVGDNGKPIASRYGFFIEDTDDMAKRNGLKEPKTPDRVPITALSPEPAARYAMFQHMIGNHDWSMRAGPAGAGCCHNGKLIGPLPGSSQYAPVPYDFDFSGMVGAPYATPPAELKIRNVKQRFYRGYCSHNAQAMKAAREIRAAQGDLMSILASTPGLDDRNKARASAYLADFFADIATDELVNAKVLKGCT
ncbi:MAG TPA: hypothetical protein VM757_06850 [Sphingomicrobium sp.]|nr:hypothetical protein [Sphingomicrobium sp.]